MVILVLVDRMRPFATTALIFLLILYFGVQAMTGERGLLSGAEREAMLREREAELASLTSQKASLQVRARYLRNESLSRDLLEERARVLLGYGDPRDVVIRVQAPS